MMKRRKRVKRKWKETRWTRVPWTLAQLSWPWTQCHLTLIWFAFRIPFSLLRKLGGGGEASGTKNIKNRYEGPPSYVFLYPKWLLTISGKHEVYLLALQFSGLTMRRCANPSWVLISSRNWVLAERRAVIPMYMCAHVCVSMCTLSFSCAPVHTYMCTHMLIPLYTCAHACACLLHQLPPVSPHSWYFPLNIIVATKWFLMFSICASLIANVEPFWLFEYLQLSFAI